MHRINSFADFENILILVFIVILTTCKITFAQSSSILLENDYFRYVIGSDGKNIGFIDKQTGIDYCNHERESHCAQIKLDENLYTVSSVDVEGDNIILKFSGSGISIVLKKTVYSDYIKLEVVAVNGGDIESLTFVNLPLTLKGKLGEPFGACALSLNLITNVEQVPALQTHLWAACYKKFGIIGAKVALIGVPQNQILEVLKKVIMDAEELPKSTLTGPWAQENPLNHSSYYFNFGDLTEATVDQWIEMIRSLGLNQVHNNGERGKFFSFGDFTLNPEKWPQGWEHFKRINDRLHQAGISSIFHTYAFFIDTDSKYLTPVPHPDLDVISSFTIAKSLSEADKTVEVVESTADVSTVTGYKMVNSALLHVDNELISFTGVTKNPPYKFTGCKRGALGTGVSSHVKGVQARHLRKYFNRFIAAPGSGLFEEIAKKHAEIVDLYNFDGMYLDAIDGGEFVWGKEISWYYCARFIYDIYKNLKKPTGMEMSAMAHHFWQFRGSWQAWDSGVRGYKRFIDLHTASIKTDCYEHGAWRAHASDINKYAPLANGGLLLPLQLGWWYFHTWSPNEIEPMSTDDIEYLGCKLIGNDAGIAITSPSDKQTLQKIPAYQRFASMLKQYEELRHAHYFDESIKSKLREPGKEFTLFQDSDGQWRFRQVQYDKHKVENVNHWSSSWKVNNPFKKQPVKFRVEALMSVKPYDAQENIVLSDFTNDKDFTQKYNADGVTVELNSSKDFLKTGTMSGRFTALNSGCEKQYGAWGNAEKNFEPGINLDKHRALGVWIYGDGQGELINFRLHSPWYAGNGRLADRYVIVDFSGWRYFELIEPESTRYNDYLWPDSTGLPVYNIYRDFSDYRNINSLSIWYNNLPPNKKVTCYISPVKAIPKIPITIKNPSISVNGKTIMFPAEMESGSYLEFYSLTDCKLFSPKGELLAEVTPQGEIPDINTGTNTIVFTGDGQSNTSIHASVTIISYGEPL